MEVEKIKDLKKKLKHGKIEHAGHVSVFIFFGFDVAEFIFFVETRHS